VPNEVEIAGENGLIVGHDSKEDAETAMDLLNLKMKEGACPL
jgi:hypothetical protein